mgnify:FL=1
MNNAHKTQPDPSNVLAKASLEAGRKLGLTQADVSAVIGRDRSGIRRDGINPDTKAGELALMLIRAYRSVYVLVGGDDAAMKHWFGTRNRHFDAVPKDLVRTAEGLVRVVHYLDAMRGRI